MIFNYIVLYCIERIPSKFIFPSLFMPARFFLYSENRITLLKKLSSLDLQMEACPCLFISFSVLALLS